MPESQGQPGCHTSTSTPTPTHTQQGFSIVPHEQTYLESTLSSCVSTLREDWVRISLGSGAPISSAPSTCNCVYVRVGSCVFVRFPHTYNIQNNMPIN